MYYYNYYCVVYLVIVFFGIVNAATTIKFTKDATDLNKDEVISRHNYVIPPDTPLNTIYSPFSFTTDFSQKTTTKTHNTHEHDKDNSSSTFDPWSVVWYLGSFGGLIAFFLVVTCSEWCCLKKRRREQELQEQQNPTSLSNRLHASVRNELTETPPPSYHLFAPPPYESITYEEKDDKFNVFVVPVHEPYGTRLPT